MSNYSVLKQDINNNIYENQTQQITGTVLNAILNEMTASLGAGYQFAGVATLGMNPGDPDQRVFYLAGEGIYTNFGGIQVPQGKLGVLKWDNRWTLQTIDGLGGGGANLTGYVSVASTDDLPEEGQPTLGYLCGTNLYLYVGEGGDTKEGKYQDCGSFRGPQGDSVQDVEQTQTSLENGGVNKIKFTLSNGISCEFQVRNGTTSSGLFPTLAALQAAYPSPVVGQYAFVGAGFPADIYVCTTAGTWTDSGEDYDGDNVDLTDYATKEEVSQLQQKVDGITLTWQEGYINSSGVLTAPDGYSQYTTQMLTAIQANGIIAVFASSYRIRVAYFNNGTFVSRTDLISASPYTIETEYDCRIMIMTAAYGTSYTLEQMLSNYQFTSTGGLMYRTSALETSMGIIEPEVQDLNITVYGIPLVWTSGNIDANGAVITPTQSNYYSQIIPNSQISGISLEVDAGYLCNLAFYDNGIFVSRYGWIYNNAGKVTISTQYDARIMIGRDTYDNTKTAEEVAAHIHITGIEEGLEKRVERLEAVNNSSDFLARMVACDFNGKILHFSFDDVCWCLYDLIQNEATYTDIFDEPFFAMLKEVHDTTGMVFTLNTFNEIGANSSGYYPTGFDIENVPTKFQSNFQANKGWLKFAFHAKDEDTNYNTASGAGTDYGVFVSAIYTLTGDYDCIDRVTRLGYFGGTLENCLALRDAARGPIGFFGADDARAYDYYLSSAQYGWLRKKGKFFDETNSLLFIKTQYRTFATGKQDVENNLCFQKVTEFFAHEYEAHPGATWDLTAMKNNILSLATWATGLGYKFEYPEKIFGYSHN